MKKTFMMLSLFTLAGVSQASSTVSIDFGRYDSQTESDGYYNIHTAEDFSTATSTANYVNGASSATTQHELSLSNKTVNLTYTHTTGQGYFAGQGLVPTLTDDEEGGNWKNAITALPTGYTLDTLKDSLTTQTANGTGSHTLTFTGLTAGTYTLSGFGGFYGKDAMSSIALTLGNDATADWSTQFNGGNGWEASSQTQGDSVTFAGVSSGTTDRGYSFTAENITVGEDGTLTLTIAGTGVNYGRTPLNSLSLTQTSVAPAVPEPATATLSLLALAGLCARRRRK